MNDTAATLEADAPAAPASIDLAALYRDSEIAATFEELDRELVGLVPVKTRVREVATLLLVDRARRTLGLEATPPALHMSFTGNPGTGKTTVALRMAKILHRLGYVRKNTSSASPATTWSASILATPPPRPRKC